MGPDLWIVDAFTSRAFRGNPAAVCWSEREADDAWRLALAAEMNLSETAFLEPRGEAFGLRWFTPVSEVDLCGHATLASAHVLYETGRLGEAQTARFLTRSGELRARRRGAQIELDFPVKPGRRCEAPADLARGLGGAEAAPAGTPLEANEWDLLVPLASESEVLALAPDFARMAAWSYRCVIATAPSASAEWDIVSRVFAPRYGIDEDPVTGSAHCFLAAHWSARLGQRVLRARQASARGGELEVELAGDRVFLRGAAVTILTGALHATARI